MRRALLGLLVGAIGYAVLLFPSAADEWTAEEINKTIEATNFIVNRGCSGTLIAINPSLVLTNYHCIDGNVDSGEREVRAPDGTVAKKKFRKYTDVTTEQKTHDGFTLVGSASYIAEIVAEAKTSDLALLKLKGRTPHSYFSPIIPDGQPVLRGEKVWIVGNPLGLESTVTAGIISANRSLDPPWADGARIPVLQISGGMSGGNSGGALYNSKGQLVGVPFAGYRGDGHLGFAITVDVVKAFLRENCFASTFDKSANDDRCRGEKMLKAKADPANKE